MKMPIKSLSIEQPMQVLSPVESLLKQTTACKMFGGNCTGKCKTKHQKDEHVKHISSAEDFTGNEGKHEK